MRLSSTALVDYPCLEAPGHHIESPKIEGSMEVLGSRGVSDMRCDMEYPRRGLPSFCLSRVQGLGSWFPFAGWFSPAFRPGSKSRACAQRMVFWGTGQRNCCERRNDLLDCTHCLNP